MYIGQIFEYKNSSIRYTNQFVCCCMADLAHERGVFLHELFDFSHERMK